jgi:hypothetical protein
MNKDLLELYSDYLLSSFSHVTATGLSAMTGGEVSHDRITRFLASEEMDSRTLWRLVKPLARQVEDDDAVLVIDDTIEDKPYTDERACLLALRSLKGSIRQGFEPHRRALSGGEVCVPVAFELVKKSGWVFDGKKEKWRRKSLKTKNELYRGMLSACRSNQLKFRYVLSDVWYSASGNMDHIKRKLEKTSSCRSRAIARWLSAPQISGGASTSESRCWNWSRTPLGKSIWSKWGSLAFGKAGLQERGWHGRCSVSG